ncbi:hypothetical protein SAQ01S_06870 [Sphingomonas aquatilis NBRC 16722]|uniref:Uncharacterized protein n=1 Tax=Sphingomonas aquatilis TaxID=93063 RepID=A0AAW3TVK0_9SPHN|nr:hypothetical protein [Sphingomonas aquatilis]MBB3876070.1 hypothetical protein [Sphingomonas aquatilis]GEM70921.1 hypothetical protein SAQ01S_06870 [Sphingomonas aquatilis NBRC 16722]
MTERHNLIAFSVLIGAICYLATIAAILAFYGKYAEALGFGGLTTGLVGVLGTFRPKSAVANVEKAETVNQGPSA